ncbi:unnamed protein product, partial [Staurois parvus]
MACSWWKRQKSSQTGRGQQQQDKTVQDSRRESQVTSRVQQQRVRSKENTKNSQVTSRIRYKESHESQNRVIAIQRHKCKEHVRATGLYVISHAPLGGGPQRP